MEGLLSYQKEAINHLSKWRVGALFMEPGTGKTRAAIEIINSIDDVDLILWIGPLRTIKRGEGVSVVEEINKWGGFNTLSLFYGVESIGQSNRIYLDVESKINDFKNVFIVIDESIKIKNYNAKRTRRILELSKKAKYKLILNGTPITRNILDIWAQMEFLSHKILNMNISEFKNTFCKYTTITKINGSRKYTKEFITGYANIDYLYSLIKYYVYECDLKMNVKENYYNVSYVLSEDDIEQYFYFKDKYLSDDMLYWKNNNIFLEMTQKMQHSYCCTPHKFDIVYKLFRDIPEEKTIIFCKYIDSFNECQKKFSKAKVLSYQKESFGLNLQQYCHTIYFDKSWDYALRIQAGRRTFRTGQQNDCKFYDLTGNVGLDRLIDKNIEKKISMSEYFKSKSIAEIKAEL